MSSPPKKAPECLDILGLLKAYFRLSQDGERNLTKEAKEQQLQSNVDGYEVGWRGKQVDEQLQPVGNSIRSGCVVAKRHS